MFSNDGQKKKYFGGGGAVQTSQCSVLTALRKSVFAPVDPSCVRRDGRLRGGEDVLAKLRVIPRCPLSSCHIPRSFTAAGAKLAALRFQPFRDSCPGFFFFFWRQSTIGEGGATEAEPRSSRTLLSLRRGRDSRRFVCLTVDSFYLNTATQ